MSGWRKAADLGASAAASPYALWWLMRPDLPGDGEAAALCLGDGGRPALALRFCRRTGQCRIPGGHRALDAADLESLLPAILPPAALRPDLRPDLRNVAGADLPPESGPPPPAPSARRWRAGSTWRAPVLMGVIDDAIPFAHERFRRPGGGSRVAWLWVQGAAHDGRSDIPCGRDYDQQEIEDLLAAHRRGGSVDEAAVYRAAGLLDPARAGVQSMMFRASHGAAVADLAGGYGAGAHAEETMEVAGMPVPVDPDKFALAFVCLPPAMVRDSSGTFAQPFIMAAIDRILALADRMREAGIGDPAVVINLSMGLTAGPKDGGTPLERHIERRVRERRRDPARPTPRFVLPAGNHRLARTRARVPVRGAGNAGAARRAALSWQLMPDDATPSFLEIWGPMAEGGRPAHPRFGVVLHPPGLAAPAATPADLCFDTAYDLLGAGGRLLARLTVQWMGAAGGRGGRERLTLAVPPTVAERRGAAIAPPGDWGLDILPGRPDSPGLAVDLFVQRDDTLPAFRRFGRQSRLNDPTYRARGEGGLPLTGLDGGGAFVLHALTINAYATGRTPLVVGGHYRDGSPVEYSGLGDAAGDGRDPDLAALADRSPWLRGVPAAGTLSGSGARYGGTSIAAPLAAREVAKAIAAGLIRGGTPDSPAARRAGLETAAGPGGDTLPRLRKRPEAAEETERSRWNTAKGMKAS